MREIRVVIISEKDEVVQNIKSEFEKLQGYNILIETAKLDRAKDQILDFNPFITIVDLSTGLETVFDLVKKIAKDMPQTYLACVATSSYQDLIVRAMRCGAKDFLKYSVDETELESLIVRAKNGCPNNTNSITKGKIITVFSNKGGTGTTSLAINMGVGLAKFKNAKVAIVDLVSQHGDVGIFLDVVPNYTIADIVENFARLDKTFLRGALTKHPSGVHILSETAHLEEANSVTGKQITHILNILKEIFDYVIIDAGDEFNDRTLAAMDLSNKILLVSLLSVPSIQNTKRCLDIFRRLRYDEAKVKLVINRYNSKNYEGKVNIEQARKTLGYEIFWMLPNDYSNLIKSINQGESIFFVNKKSAFSSSLVNLIKVLTDNISASGGIQAKRGVFGKVINKFSRTKGR